MVAKNILGLIGITIIMFMYSYYQYYQQISTYQISIPQYHYYINKNHLISQQSSSIIQINHNSTGLTQYLQLEIQLKTGKKVQIEVKDIYDNVIQQNIQQVLPSNIKHTILKSKIPLNIPSKPRLLQGLTTNNNFIIYSIVGFSKILAVIRNLIFICLLTNLFQLFLPLIIFSQSFLMLAFWTNDKHLLTGFYQNIFNSKLDLFNIIRLIIYSSPDDNNNLPILSTYGYSNYIFFNLSGQFIITAIVLIGILIIKAINIFLKLQKFRFLNSKVRSVWNGYIFSIMPRIAVFASFQFRTISQLSFFTVLNVGIASILLILLIVYFIQLLFQIRKINSRVQYLQQSRLQIGLVKRIDYKKQFNFDCLKYSMLYYPAMNYIRLLIFFLPIGFSYDFHYVQFGGAIVSQIFYIMVNISSPGYLKIKDKIIYVFLDFLFIVIQLSLISIGLAQSVKHSQVSIIAQIIIFALIFLLFIVYLICIIIDLITYGILDQLKTKSNAQKAQQQQVQFIKNISKSSNKKLTQKTKSIKNVTIIDDKSQNISSQSQKQNDSTITLKKGFKLPQAKIKKVRKGKII